MRQLILEYAELTHIYGTDSKQAEEIRNRYKDNEEFQKFADAIDELREEDGKTRRYR